MTTAAVSNRWDDGHRALAEDNRPPTRRRDPAAPAGRSVKITWADTIAAVKVIWAWTENGWGRIPAGSFSIAAGREGTGKSSFGIWATAQITRGILPGMWFGTPRRVLYAAVEDSWKHTLVPRLTAAGADLAMVGRVEVTTTGDDDLVLSLPDDLGALEKVIREHGIALVILDPLLSMIGEGIDTHRSREVRQALDPLAKLSDRTGAVILGIAHFNKGAGTDAATLITGSGAFKDVPRSVFGFARDDDGRVMTQVKNSLGRDDLPSRTYEINSTRIEVTDGITDVGVFTFTGESERTVSDVLGARAEVEVDTQNGAAKWLAAYLVERGGEAPAREVLAAGQAVGIGDRTLQRARKRAGVTSKRVGFGDAGGFVWNIDPPPLATHRTQPPKDVMNGFYGDGDTAVSSVTPTAIDAIGDRDSRLAPMVANGRHSTPPPGNPVCGICGRANLYSRESIARRTCASCVVKAAVTA